MAQQGKSVAQQDALSNAFLALFGILVLVLIQIGFEHVDARARQRAYARPPAAIDALDGGWTPAAWAPRPAVITIATPSPHVRVVPGRPAASPVTGAPATLAVEAFDGWSSAGAVHLYRIFPGPAAAGAPGRSAAGDSDRTLRVENPLPGTAAAVEVWLDDGRMGKPGESLEIEAGRPLTLRLCADGTALAFLGHEGACR